MRISLFSIVAGLAMAAPTGMAAGQQAKGHTSTIAGEAVSAHGSSSDAPAAAAAAKTGTKGKVVETMNAGAYTYVRVDTGSKKFWAAAPRFAVGIGDQVIVPAGTPMPNFHSNTLNRTFDMVSFVGGVRIVGAGTAARQVAAAHGTAAAKGPAATLDLSGIRKADGGYTIAGIFGRKAELAGKDVAVRGKVAKFTPDVMRKNWIHLRDGTGKEGTDDLTATTSAHAAVGDTVLVRGKLSVDRDFGYGYKYDVLIEDATVTVE